MFHDLRSVSHLESKSPPPFYYSTLHESHVWKAQFHPDSADILFTCSEDGSLFMYELEGLAQYEQPSHRNFQKERVHARKLCSGSLGINSFAVDATKNCIVSAREDESVTIHVNLL